MSQGLSSFAEHLAFHAMETFSDKVIADVLRNTENYKRVKDTHTFFICRKCLAVINVEDVINVRDGIHVRGAALAGQVDFVENCAACMQPGAILIQQEDPWEGRDKPNDTLPGERPSEYAMRKSSGK